jgi:hypothetical protein
VDRFCVEQRVTLLLLCKNDSNGKCSIARPNSGSIVQCSVDGRGDIIVDACAESFRFYSSDYWHTSKKKKKLYHSSHIRLIRRPIDKKVRNSCI